MLFAYAERFNGNNYSYRLEYSLQKSSFSLFTTSIFLMCYYGRKLKIVIIKIWIGLAHCKIFEDLFIYKKLIFLTSKKLFQSRRFVWVTLHENEYAKFLHKTSTWRWCESIDVIHCNWENYLIYLLLYH